jgi:hypothetical protein
MRRVCFLGGSSVSGRCRRGYPLRLERSVVLFEVVVQLLQLCLLRGRRCRSVVLCEVVVQLLHLCHLRLGKPGWLGRRTVLCSCGGRSGVRAWHSCGRQGRTEVGNPREAAGVRWGVV